MKFSDDPRKIQKEIIKRSFFIAFIPLLLSLIKGELAVFKGFLFGLLVSILLFRLLLLQLEKALDMETGRASNYMRNRYFIKFAIYFIILLLARKNPSINFLAAAAGLLLIKFTILGSMFLETIHNGIQNKIESLQ